MIVFCFQRLRETALSDWLPDSSAVVVSLLAFIPFPPCAHLRLDGQVVPGVGGGVAVRLSHGESRGKKGRKKFSREERKKSETLKETKRVLLFRSPSTREASQERI